MLSVALTSVIFLRALTSIEGNRKIVSTDLTSAFASTTPLVDNGSDVFLNHYERSLSSVGKATMLTGVTLFPIVPPEWIKSSVPQIYILPSAENNETKERLTSLDDTRIKATMRWLSPTLETITWVDTLNVDSSENDVCVLQMLVFTQKPSAECHSRCFCQQCRTQHTRCMLTARNTPQYLQREMALYLPKQNFLISPLVPHRWWELHRNGEQSTFQPSQSK